jgi:hypothetical protein
VDLDLWSVAVRSGTCLKRKGAKTRRSRSGLRPDTRTPAAKIARALQRRDQTVFPRMLRLPATLQSALRPMGSAAGSGGRLIADFDCSLFYSAAIRFQRRGREVRGETRSRGRSGLRPDTRTTAAKITPALQRTTEPFPRGCFAYRYATSSAPPNPASPRLRRTRSAPQ